MGYFLPLCSVMVSTLYSNLGKVNFAINTTSSSGTDKAVYLKAIADAIATEIGTSVNRTFLGYVFVSGVDAFSCVGSVRNGVFRFVCTSTNTATYAVVRDSSGAVTYREFASQTSIDALNNRITNNLGLIVKETTTTDSSITFTFTGNRYNAILMIQSNAFSGSGIYALVYKKGGSSSVKCLVGNESLPTIDSDGSITFSMVSWSKAVLYTTQGSEFS